MKIIWREKALKDLEDVYNFLASVNKRAAVELYNSILKEVEILIEYPSIAPIQHLNQKLDFPLRGLLTKDKTHKIMYFVDNDNIFITQIWDCRKHPDKIRRK